MTTPPNIVLFPNLPEAAPIADNHRLAVEQGDTLTKGALFSSIKAWLFAGFLQAYANGAASIRARADNFYAIESRRASPDANPSAISLEKSRGTIASPAPIVAGDGIASVAGRAWDGSAWNVGGQFRFDCVTFAGAGNFTTRFLLQLRTGTGLSTVMAVDPNGVTTFTSLTEFGVGIQTTTASAQTALLGQPVAIFDNTSPALGNGLGLRFRIADTGGTLRNAAQIQAIAAAKTGSAITPRLAFLVGVTERATILDDGNVGIGTTAPSTRLHVSGSSGNLGLFSGGTRALRIAANANVSEVASTDQTGFSAFHPLNLAATEVRITNGAVLRPGADNTQSLGNASFRWSTVFAGTGTINTSDARQKVKRGGFTDAELDAWADVQPLIYRWKDSIERKGDAARQHAGYIAQEIAAAFDAHGLNAADYGLWCEDPVTKAVKRAVTKPVQKMRKVSVETLEVEIRDGKPVQVRKAVERDEPETEMVEVRDETGSVVRDSEGKPLMHPVPVMEDREVEETEEVPDGTRLGLRYDQCAVFEAAWARREIERLRSRIADLEALSKND